MSVLMRRGGRGRRWEPTRDRSEKRAPLRILWRFARAKVGALLLGLVLGLVASATALASPLVIRAVLDSLAGGVALALPVVLLVALLVVGAGVGWWQQVVLGTVAEDIVFEARAGLVRRYFGARVLALLGRPQGELVTRVTSDSVLLREAVSTAAVGLVNSVVMLVGSVVLMAVLDVVLAVTTVVAIASTVAVVSLLMPAISRAYSLSQEALGDLGGELAGSLRAMKTVKVAQAEEREIERLLERAGESRRFSIRAVRRGGMVWTISSAGIQGAIIVILGVGALRVASEAMTVPTLVAFLLYAFGIVGPVSELSRSLSSLQSGIAAAARIREIEMLPQEHSDPSTPSRSVGAAPLLELRNVSARYEGSPEKAVDGIHLTIPHRGHVALVGPSGAGKTSVLSLVLRFIDPSEGEVLLDGVGYGSRSVASVRSALAYVEQETPVLPGTIRRNLLYARPDASDAEVAAALDAVRLSDKIASLPEGLDTALRDTTVSGGQRQRIALARALLARPRLLLLDEATAQVDGITEAAIHDAIRAQARRGAVLTIAHRLSTVLDADEIVVMDAGRVVARGTHSVLLDTSELYRELVAALRIGGESRVVL